MQKPTTAAAAINRRMFHPLFPRKALGIHANNHLASAATVFPFKSTRTIRRARRFPDTTALPHQTCVLQADDPGNPLQTRQLQASLRQELQ